MWQSTTEMTMKNVRIKQQQFSFQVPLIKTFPYLSSSFLSRVFHLAIVTIGRLIREKAQMILFIDFLNCPSTNFMRKNYFKMN